MIPRAIDSPNAYNLGAGAESYIWMSYHIWEIDHLLPVAFPSTASSLRRSAFQPILRYTGESGPHRDSSVSLVSRVLGTELGTPASASIAYDDLCFRNKHLTGLHNLTGE